MKDLHPGCGLSLDRRLFLKRSAAVVAGAAIWDAGFVASAVAKEAGEKPQADVSLGFSLYGMRSLSVDEALELCAQIGYDCVEVVANEGWPCDPGSLSQDARKDIRRRMDGLGLELAGIMENLILLVDQDRHAQNLERLKAAGGLGHDLSPEDPPPMETILGGRPNQWDEVKTEMVDRLGDWARAGEAAEIAIAVKPHVGGALHRPDDAKWLIDQVHSPWIKLVYDYSHFQLREFDLAKSLEMLLADTVLIHVKDGRGTAEKVQFLLPGEGTIDYVAYVRALKEAAYRGPVVVEVSSQIHGLSDYDPRAAAGNRMRALRLRLRRRG